jgi:RNA polymerase sigma factor (sigma-70 family)
MSGPLTERERWLGMLRTRFLEIARRRVAAAAVEDTVQEALRVVYERGIVAAAAGQVRMEDGLPPLAWCFQVLRNTIGNHYQRQQHRRHETLSEAHTAASPEPDPLESLEQGELARQLGAALDALALSAPDCARHLRRLLAGATPAALAADEGLAAEPLYRRLYRCRARLRELLIERGVLP